MSAPLPPTALAAAMRNEGPYLLEWLAYHRLLGFDEIIVITNDCTDGSDGLLDALQKRGLVTHIAQTLPQGGHPQDSAMRLTFEHLKAKGTEWLCHIDADEFLNIGAGAGRLADLFESAGTDADVIALPWRLFGTSGHAHRTLPTLPNFTACEAELSRDRVKFKSLFRLASFGHAGDHQPLEPLKEDYKVVSATGTQLRRNLDDGVRRSKYLPLRKSLEPDTAQINHYATRSLDDFLMKNDRGDGHGVRTTKYRAGSKWFEIADQNDAQDSTILRHWPATEALLQSWRSDAEIKALEDACLAADTAARARFLTPERRAKLQARP